MPLGVSPVYLFVIMSVYHILITTYLSTNLRHPLDQSREKDTTIETSVNDVVEDISINRVDYERLKSLVVSVHRKKVLKKANIVDDTERWSHMAAIADPSVSVQKYSNRSYCTDEFRRSHFLTIEKHMGRAGNWIFQLLALLATSKTLCYTPILLTNYGVTRYVQLSELLVTEYFGRVDPSEKENWKVFNESAPCKYNKAIENLNTRFNWSLHGFFQSWKYFFSHEDYVRSMLIFSPFVSNRVREVINKISRDKTQMSNVCVHIRRKDMLRKSTIEHGFNVGNITFIKAAMALFRSAFHETGYDVQFMIVTDDFHWCVDNIKDTDVYMSPFSKVGGVTNIRYDLALLKACDHTITTGGSFGWIGGWLAKGAVVYYSDFHRKGSNFHASFNAEDYYPDEWIGLGDRELSALYSREEL